VVATYNCVCDGLAKTAEFGSSQQWDSRNAERFLLPLECAVVFISGVKQTSDVSKAIQFFLGEVDAFYTAPLDITERNSNPKTALTKWLGQPLMQFWIQSLTCAVYGSLNSMDACQSRQQVSKL
jgi:hypothetical protein